MASLYDSTRWRRARAAALARDGFRCTVGRLLGGPCSPAPLHVHHLVPVSEGGDLYSLDNLATVCARHHRTWEALRRALLERRQPPRRRCPHRHRTAEARALCERRLARISA